jgi:hypothetical protein
MRHADRKNQKKSTDCAKHKGLHLLPLIDHERNEFIIAAQHSY